jgi:hypothetical protein
MTGLQTLTQDHRDDCWSHCPCSSSDHRCAIIEVVSSALDCCSSDLNMQKVSTLMKALLDVACKTTPEESLWHDTGMDSTTTVSVYECPWVYNPSVMTGLQTLPKFAGIIVDLIVLPVLLIIDLQC